MRKVYCDVCGNEFNDEELLISDICVWKNQGFLEIKINTLSGAEDVCNNCRREILEAAKIKAQEIKEGFENGKETEKES